MEKIILRVVIKDNTKTGVFNHEMRLINMEEKTIF